MRVVAISRVVNEADIIEAFVRHTASFVDQHFILDNGSSDGTLEIMLALKQEGFALSILQTQSVSFCESAALTGLYREACRVDPPDWVLCLDADEFLDDRQLPGGLLLYLSNLIRAGAQCDCLHIPMVNYAATSHDDGEEINVPLRIRNRQAPSDAYKIILRGNLLQDAVRIENGSHGATFTLRPTNVLVEPRLWLAHFSERSPYQSMAKFVRGWSKVLAAGRTEVAKGTAEHYRTPYELLRDKPESLLCNQHFMGFKNQTPDLVTDPIDYKGGALKYTRRQDEALRAVLSLMGFLENLAMRHGEILETIPEARRLILQWESATKVIA